MMEIMRIAAFATFVASEVPHGPSLQMTSIRGATHSSSPWCRRWRVRVGVP
jgi:hypothetical protein